MQRDIAEIFQQEQDHAMLLLSSSPMLAALLLSYSSRTETEKRIAFRETIIKSLEENQRLKSEAVGMARRFRAAAAAQKTVRSQLSSLKGVSMVQQDAIASLREQLDQVEDRYDRLMVGSNAEKAALHVQILDLEVHRQPCLALDRNGR
jgi:small-conductance mechanosensitive channel